MLAERQDIEELLNQGNCIQIKPQGYSMYPVLVPGRDAVIVEPVGTTRPKRGDVVLYRRSPEEQGILVLHRIWKTGKGGYYMVGDNQQEIEGPLDASCIKGIMVAMIRKGKHISVKNPIYRLLTSGWLLLRPLRHRIAGIAARIKKWCRKSK